VTGLARKVVALELHAVRQDRINKTLMRQISDLTAASPRADASTRTASRANNDRWQLCEIAATLGISPGMFGYWKDKDVSRFGRCEWWEKSKSSKRAPVFIYTECPSLPEQVKLKLAEYEAQLREKERSKIAICDPETQ
jgi:hypothetical protein